MLDKGGSIVATLPATLNVACWVTLSRLCLLPVALLFASLQTRYGWLIAALICAVAGVSDILDGYLARRQNCSTTLGSILDLLADKLFVSTMMIVLAMQGVIPFWMPGVVIVREIVISAMRQRRLRKNQPISPDPWGKAKMVISIVAVTGLLLRQGLYLDGAFAQTGVTLAIYPILDLAWWIMLLAVVLTVFSGVHYLVSYLGLAHED